MIATLVMSCQKEWFLQQNLPSKIAFTQGRFCRQAPAAALNRKKMIRMRKMRYEVFDYIIVISGEYRSWLAPKVYT